MIGLIVLALAGFWLYICGVVARAVARSVRPGVLSSLAGFAAFLALAVLPFIDEVVGRWQFKRLCEQEAVAWVSPNAAKVVAARSDSSFSHRQGLVFGVQEQAVKYEDAVTGEVFYSVKAFHTKGGALMRAGLGLDNTTSCWPEASRRIDAELKLNELLKRGKQ